MTAKDYLREIRAQEFRLRSIEEAILVLETKATKVTSTWSDMPGGGMSDGISGIIVKLIDTKRKYITEWDKLIDARNEAELILSRMSNKNYSTLLWLYYIRCKNWLEVSEAMSFSESYVFTMHGMALAEFQGVMDSK